MIVKNGNILCDECEQPLRKLALSDLDDNIVWKNMCDDCYKQFIYKDFPR